MARFSLPPADVSWLDRAQSTDGPFMLAHGYVLAELDGEIYAISGRYSGIPDAEETARLVAELHLERFGELGCPSGALLDSVTILDRMRPLDERTRWTFSRYV